MQVCDELKLITNGDYFSLPRFAQPAPFDDKTGDLVDEAAFKRLGAVVTSFVAFARKLKSAA